MFKTFRWRWLVIGLISVALSAMPAVAAASHSWGTYHWARTINPFTLKLGDNVTGAWDPYLATTSSDWSTSLVLDTTVVTGQAKGKNCRPTSGRVEVCNGLYGNNGWLGIAQIWVQGSHITQGSVRVNDTYFNTPTYNTTAWRNLVMCQEVGHIFGLDHQDEIFGNPNLGTCMDYTNDPATNQHPNLHDYEQLELIYAHLDSTTTVGQVVRSAGAPAVGWGRLIRGNGQSSLFVADLGSGQAVFTFVVWAQ